MKAQNNGTNYQPRFLAPKEKKGKKTALIVALCVLGAALLIGGGIFGVKAYSDHQRALELAATEPPTTEPPETEPPTTEPPETEPPETEPTEEETEPPTEPPYAPDDELLELMGNNADVYGRFRYGDGEPQFMVHGSNNSYYLYYDVYGNYARDGAIFIDARNTIDPRDTHLLVHGHNMDVTNTGHGGTFANLFLFRDQNYLAKYPIFAIETETEVQYYVPYAISIGETAYGNAGFYDPSTWNFSTDDAFNAFVQHFVDRTLYGMPVTAEAGDKLMTLSTCLNDGTPMTELRLFVSLRMLREDETVEQMRTLYRQALRTLPSKEG